MMADAYKDSHAPAKEHGFSISDGVDWSDYLVYRPIYPVSFYQRIYEYHSQKKGARWSVAHDIGAGCGIVTSALASRFDSVVVSDPNDGNIPLARRLLVEEGSLPESNLRFLQEPAEKSSVQSGTVDLIAACECIHWTNSNLAIKEFARELVPGGTLVITFYSRPLIEGNERAQRAWKAVWDAHSAMGQRDVDINAHKLVNTALDPVEFPETGWSNVKRVYINAQLRYEAFRLNDRVGESKVKPGEEQIWVEEVDEDWCHMHGFEWFQGYRSTWPPDIPVSEIQEIWDELEDALGGERVKTKTPIVMLLATKKG
jgi:SAM-dependent methyltransferase